MSKHTPGPWTLGREWIDDGDGSEIEIFFVLAEDGEPITDQPIYEADACLMAAAPDLLEAIDEFLGVEARMDSGEPEYNAAREKCIQAIAKAKGEA